MGFIAAITAGLEAAKAFFGWKTQKEINRPADKKREEIQEIRTERDRTDEEIDRIVDSHQPKP